MAGDLFIKERLPDGSFGELKPAFPDGMTTEQKLAKKEAELHLLTSQNQALSERSEFIEELIAELAMIVYS